MSRWLPVALWMFLIFGFSTDVGSSKRTSRIIGPVLRWLVPNISDEAIGHVQHVVRKGGHLTEYAILALLLWRARRGPAHAGRWIPQHAVFAVAVATLFAITDEWHQSTVPSRQGQATDVLIDATGAGAGLLLLWAAGRRWHRW